MGKRLDKLLIAVSMVFVLGIVACLYLFPEGSQNVANRIFGAMTDMFGSLTLIFAFGGILLLMLVSFSNTAGSSWGRESRSILLLNGYL